MSHCDSVRQHPHHWEHKTETSGNRYNARPDRGGVWMVIPACSPDLKHTEHLDQLWCAVCARATNTTTLADLQRRRRNSRNSRFVYQTLLFRIPTVCTNKSAGVKLWYQNTSGLEEEQECQRSEQRSSDVLKTNKQRWQDNSGELQVVSCVFLRKITMATHKT